MGFPGVVFNSGFPSTTEIWTCWKESIKGPQEGEVEHLPYEGKAERAETVWPGQEKARSDLIEVFN